MKMTFKINVKTINNVRLVFSKVKNYKIEGNVITFRDSKTERIKVFPTDGLQVEEDEDNE